MQTVRKKFPRYDQKIFMNVVTDDESCMHYFEPHQIITNQGRRTKIHEGLDSMTVPT